MKKILKIDNRNWYQSMSYSLRGIESGESSFIESFWVIRSDSLEAVKLKATRKGTDILDINNVGIAANMVEVTLGNKFLAMLWQGRYWFRKKDNIFIKCKESNGPPYTSETVICLNNEYINKSENRSLLNRE